MAVGPAGALGDGGDGRGAEFGHHEVVDEGRVFGGGGHPAGEVGFEGVVVCVAGVGGLAGDFVHDCLVGGGEEDVRAVEDAQDALFPDVGAVGLGDG